jgi:hypothetical protein
MIDDIKLRELIRNSQNSISTISIMLKNNLISKDKLQKFISKGVVEGDFSLNEVKEFPFISTKEKCL